LRQSYEEVMMNFGICDDFMIILCFSKIGPGFES